jgi:hypothetical protein
MPPAMAQLREYAAPAVSVPVAGQLKLNSAITVPLTVTVAVCPVGVVLSVTLIVALNGPATVGVPLITSELPDTLIPNPDGKEPALSAPV